MEKYLGLLIALFLLPLTANADGTAAAGTPCEVSIKSIGELGNEPLRFWGKVLDIRNGQNSAPGKEVAFEPKTTFVGAKKKRLRVFMKEDRCRIDIKKDDHFHVSLNEKDEGTLVLDETVNISGAKKIAKKSSKYPVFRPDYNPCMGFRDDLGFKSADLFVLAKVKKVEVDLAENTKVIFFEVKKIWNGDKRKSIKVIDQIEGVCPKKYEIGSTYDLILNAANSEYYYLDCCGHINGPVEDDYEQRFSNEREIRKKNLLNR